MLHPEGEATEGVFIPRATRWPKIRKAAEGSNARQRSRGDGGIKRASSKSEAYKKPRCERARKSGADTPRVLHL